MTDLPSSPPRRAATRRSVLSGLGVAAIAGLARPAFAAEPVTIGVSGPLTGPAAQYGAQWKKGFDLALEEINGAGGGIKGRKLVYQFEDSQSDPRQSVAIGQKFVGDPNIVVELGDFSSPASMAASPIYQRGKLVQFGFTNSHPDFTKGGDYMWSNSISQSELAPSLSRFMVTSLALKKIAILHLNTDWGRTSKDLAAAEVKKLGGTVTATEGYLPDEKDFRSTLVRVRDSNPDGIMLVSYYADAALIARQARVAGLNQPMVGASSIYSPKFIELAGDAGNGVYTQSNFFPDEPRPEVQDFVKAFTAKYHETPDSFCAYAFDTINLMAAVMRQYGTTRKDIHDGLGKISGVSSVIFGKVSFDTETRRVAGAQTVNLEVIDNKFATWDGKPAKPRT
jgi:branched-chain amino acid transport system substrate-binding protein